MTEWPPRLDQGRDEVCVASGFPVCSKGMARPCPVGPAPSLGLEQVPPVPAPTPGAGAPGGAKDGGPEPGGHNSQDRNQSWSLWPVLPFAAQRSPMDGVEQSPVACPPVPSPVLKDVSGQLPSHPGLLAGLQDPVHDVLWEVSPSWPVAGPSWGPPLQATFLPGQEGPEWASSSLWAGGEAARLGSPPVPQGQSVGAAACGHPAKPRPPVLVPLASLPVGAPSSHLPGTLLWAGPGPCPAPQAFGLPLIRAP